MRQHGEGGELALSSQMAKIFFFFQSRIQMDLHILHAPEHWYSYITTDLTTDACAQQTHSRRTQHTDSAPLPPAVGPHPHYVAASTLDIVRLGVVGRPEHDRAHDAEGGGGGRDEQADDERGAGQRVK